jgi:hypothetical protein
MTADQKPCPEDREPGYLVSRAALVRPEHDSVRGIILQGGGVKILAVGDKL